MHRYLLLIWGLAPCCSIAIKIGNTELPILSTRKGQVQGTIIETEYGNKAYGFQGIPYAEAPTGRLRFKKPVAKKRWSGIFNANEYGAGCTQLDLDPGPFRATQYTYGEDCLTINIFTPMKGLPSNQSYPVLYYIFPGANEFGTLQQYPEETLIDNFVSRGLILVMVNYRVSGLGFWTSGTDDAPGNLALWDMLMGLQWVQDEIEAFGGDPKSVTLMGCSSAAAAISVLSLSPLANDLFQQGIMLSGSALTVGGTTEDGSDVVRCGKVATQLGCNDGNEWEQGNYKKVLKCMQRLDALKIQSVYHENVPGHPVLPYLVGSIPRVDGPDGIVPKDPFIMGRTRRPIKVITGTTTFEFPSFKFNDAVPGDVDPLCDISAITYAPANPGPVSAACMYRYKDGFINDVPASNHTFWNQQLTLITNDPLGFGPAFADADSLRSAGSDGVYLYSYDHPTKGLESLTPFHASDLGPLFRFRELESMLTEDDIRVGRIHSELFSNFVKTGNPTPTGSSSVPKWRPLQRPTDFGYYSIKLKPSMNPFYHYDGIEFWESIVPYLVKFGKQVSGFQAATTSYVGFSAKGSFAMLAAVKAAKGMRPVHKSTGPIIGVMAGTLAIIIVVGVVVVKYKRRNRCPQNLIEEETKLLSR